MKEDNLDRQTFIPLPIYLNLRPWFATLVILVYAISVSPDACRFTNRTRLNPRSEANAGSSYLGAIGTSESMINAAQQLAEHVLADIELVDLKCSEKCRHLSHQG